MVLRHLWLYPISVSTFPKVRPTQSNNPSLLARPPYRVVVTVTKSWSLCPRHNWCLSNKCRRRKAPVIRRGDAYPALPWQRNPASAQVEWRCPRTMSG